MSRPGDGTLNAHISYLNGSLRPQVFVDLEESSRQMCADEDFWLITPALPRCATIRSSVAALLSISSAAPKSLTE